MAFLLDNNEQNIEYVYPFVCGLCGFGSSNIDVFHHHFEGHGNDVPSSVFHLCELESLRNDESSYELNIGSYCCKTCNHSFATVCHLVKHLNDDSSTDKYIMDLQTKTAYPLTSQCASVLSHTFLSESDNTEDKIIHRTQNLDGNFPAIQTDSANRNINNARAGSMGGKFGPMQSSNQRLELHSFEELLQQAQSNQKAANAIYLDYNDDVINDDNDEDSNVVSVMSEVTIEHVEEEKTKKRRCVSPRRKLGDWLNCRYCGLSFRKRSKRTEHEQEHSTEKGNLKYRPDKLTTCDRCGCVMLKFKIHLHSCPFRERIRRPRAKDGEPIKGKDQRIVSCPYCDKKVKKYFLSHHVNRVHQEHDPVTCDICGKVFNHKYALSVHKNLHRIEKRFPCIKCGRCFFTRSKLKTHMLSHSDARNFQCQLCPANYKFRRTLKSHMNRIHEKKEELFHCDQCPKHYNYKDGLRQHMRRIHNIWRIPADPDKLKKITEKPKKPKHPKKKEEKPEKPKEPVDLSCEICGKVLHSNYALTNHLKSHGTDIRVENMFPFLCDQCPQTYTSRHGLQRHRNRKHSTGEPVLKEYLCEHCLKVFTHLDSLRKHKSRHHKPGQDWLLCGFKGCRFKFKSQAELDKHTKLHQEVVSFVCKDCGKSFMTLKYLAQHNQRLHSKESKQDKTSEEAEVTKAESEAADQTDVNEMQAHLEDHSYGGASLEEGSDTSTDHPSGEKDALSVHTVLQRMEKRFPCSKCGRRFFSRSKLKTHMLSHSDARNFQCQLCPANYKFPRNLRSHMNRIHPDKEEIFQCDLCPKHYNYKDGLGQHMRRVHNNSRIPAGQHMRRVHNNKRIPAAVKQLYKCDKCDEKLMTGTEIIQHLTEVHNVHVNDESLLSADTLVEGRSYVDDTNAKPEQNITDREPGVQSPSTKVNEPPTHVSVPKVADVQPSSSVTVKAAQQRTQSEKVRVAPATKMEHSSTKPATVRGQPSIAHSKSAASRGKPSLSGSKSTAKSVQSSVTSSESTEVREQPSISGSKSTTRNVQFSSIGTTSSAEVNGHPSLSESKSTAKSVQSSVTSSESTEVRGQPSISGSKSTTRNVQFSIIGTKLSTEVNRQLSLSGSRLTSGSTQSSITSTKSTAVRGQPSISVLKSTSGSARSSVKGSKVILISRQTAVTLSKSTADSVERAVTGTQVGVGTEKPVVTDSKADVSSAKPVVTDSEADISSGQTAVKDSKADVKSAKPAVLDSEADIYSGRTAVTGSKADERSAQSAVTNSKADERSGQTAVTRSKSAAVSALSAAIKTQTANSTPKIINLRKRQNQRTPTNLSSKMSKFAATKEGDTAVPNDVNIKRQNDNGASGSATSQTIKHGKKDQKVKVMTTLMTKQVKGKANKEICAPSLENKPTPENTVNSAKRIVKSS